MNPGDANRQFPSQTIVEVWSIKLDKLFYPHEQLDRFLSMEERNRSERYIYARDAIQFRCCRAMLRLGLAWYLETTPQGIALGTNGHGKPCLSEKSALHFNVSHSGGLGLIAFTTAGEVGIDVEATQCIVEASEIAEAHFTRKEASAIAAARTPLEQTQIFLRYWTRKEAVLKAAGYGLLGGMDRIDVSQQPVNLVSLGRTSEGEIDSSWLVQDLETLEGFVGAVAAPVGNWSIRQRPVFGMEEMNEFAARFARA